MATVDGKRYFVPSVWGTEALVYNTERGADEYGKASLGDLFDPKYEGKVCVRPHSALAAMGRYLDAQGKLPQPWIDSYKDMDAMKAALGHHPGRGDQGQGEHRPVLVGRERGPGGVQHQRRVLGLNWDSTGYNLQSDGSFGYIAPKEGAFAWNQGFVLLKNAKNVEQAHEFAKFVATPEGSALRRGLPANPVAKGAIDLADPKVKAFYKAAFPGDALRSCGGGRQQTSEFMTLRNEYADKYQAA